MGGRCREFGQAEAAVSSEHKPSEAKVTDSLAEEASFMLITAQPLAWRRAPQVVDAPIVLQSDLGDRADEEEMYRLGLLYEDEDERDAGFHLDMIAHDGPIHAIKAKRGRWCQTTMASSCIERHQLANQLPGPPNSDDEDMMPDDESIRDTLSDQESDVGVVEDTITYETGP